MRKLATVTSAAMTHSALQAITSLQVSVWEQTSNAVSDTVTKIHKTNG